MGRFGIGQAALRLEDQRFLTGQGRYVDDVTPPNALFGVMVRSPHAHARIRRIDASAALAAGALAVLTHDDVTAAGWGELQCPITLPCGDGQPMAKPTRPIFANGVARYVGEGVAFVVAESLALARDAADLVDVDYDDLPALIDPEAAWPTNRCFDWESGDAGAAGSTTARAQTVVSLRIVNNRLIPNAMETRAAIGEYDGVRFTLTTNSQGSHGIQRALAVEVMKIPTSQLRVVTPDVGGGFGTKIFPYPEQAVALLAAKQLGRPVKWVADRTEGSLSDAHGRASVASLKLALDGEARFMALTADIVADLGAYLSPFGPYVQTAGTSMLTGLYDIPDAHVRVRGVFTNTTPVDAYRGAGRPEASYMIERLVTEAARVTGLDPAEIRRRNFIRPEALPYRTPLGQTYDSGNYVAVMEEALRRADADGVSTRKAAALARGRRLGFGIATYVEVCSGGSDESAILSVDPAGHIDIVIGTQSNGQGHATAYAQMASEHLDLPLERFRTLQGDTDVVPTGRGTGGSRSIPVGGAAAHLAAASLKAKAQRWAAHLLECAEADLTYADGLFTIAGTDRSVGLFDLAAQAAAGAHPPGEDPTLSAKEAFKPAAGTYPNGCHAVELEVDPDTGTVAILRYTIVDDVGTVINPTLLAGQIIGGVAQGVGQALLEECRYDVDTGQLISASLQDYALPRAADLPFVDFSTLCTPCATHPLGVKGAGEAGTIGSTPAVTAALLDALAPLGVREIDLPATPVRVWRTIQAARARR